MLSPLFHLPRFQMSAAQGIPALASLSRNLQWISFVVFFQCQLRRSG